MKKKAQIFIFEIFIILICVLLILFIELNIFTYYNLEKKNKINKLADLKNILFTEKIVSNNYLLAKKDQITYSNNIDLKDLNKLKNYKQISNIKLDNKIILKNSKTYTNCYTRGIVSKNKFKILEVCYEK